MSYPVMISCVVRPTVFKLRPDRVEFSCTLSKDLFQPKQYLLGLGIRNLALRHNSGGSD